MVNRINGDSGVIRLTKADPITMTENPPKHQRQEGADGCTSLVAQGALRPPTPEDVYTRIADGTYDIHPDRGSPPDRTLQSQVYAIQQRCGLRTGGRGEAGEWDGEAEEAFRAYLRKPPRRIKAEPLPPSPTTLPQAPPTPRAPAPQTPPAQPAPSLQPSPSDASDSSDKDADEDEDDSSEADAEEDEDDDKNDDDDGPMFAAKGRETLVQSDDGQQFTMHLTDITTVDDVKQAIMGNFGLPRTSELDVFFHAQLGVGLMKTLPCPPEYKPKITFKVLS